MMRSKTMLLGLTGLCALAFGSAPARAAEPQAPKADEIRLTIKMGERTVSFLSKQEPLVRKTMVFEESDHAPTDEMRAAVAELLPLLQATKGDSAFVVTAYAADPVVAYRRARAVRGELIERHQVSAARLIAAGRAASGHVGGATVVDLHEINPSACTGCGETPFRAIAYDSGTTRLVTMLPERLATAVTVPGPLVAAAPPAKPTAARPAARPAVVQAIVPAAPAPAADARGLRMPAYATAPVASGGCPRPKIIIDDYYPGGPLVPCRATSRGGRG